MVLPPRITLVCGVDNCFKLFNEFCALMLCTVPNIAFIVITTKITIVLSTSPDTIEIIAAIIRIITNKSLNCDKNTINALLGFVSSNSL